MDGTQTVTAELEIVCHDPSTSIAQIKRRLSVERRSRVGVRNIHIGQRKPIEEISAVVSNLLR